MSDYTELKEWLKLQKDSRHNIRDYPEVKWFLSAIGQTQEFISELEQRDKDLAGQAVGDGKEKGGKMTNEFKTTLLSLLKDCQADEIAHLELRMIRDAQAPRFEALRESHPEIYADFMKARTGPHEVLLINRRKRVEVLTALIEKGGDEKCDAPVIVERMAFAPSTVTSTSNAPNAPQEPVGAEDLMCKCGHHKSAHSKTLICYFGLCKCTHFTTRQKAEQTVSLPVAQAHQIQKLSKELVECRAARNKLCDDWIKHQQDWIRQVDKIAMDNNNLRAALTVARGLLYEFQHNTERVRETIAMIDKLLPKKG